MAGSQAQALGRTLKLLEPGQELDAVVAGCRKLASRADDRPSDVDLWREYRMWLKLLLDATSGEADAGLADALSAMRAASPDVT